MGVGVSQTHGDNPAGIQDFIDRGGAGFAGGTAQFDNRFHVFRFGLNYQFAAGKAPVGKSPTVVSKY